MHRGMSVRTVQRKVHALMEVANVRTRMQLAWEAAHRQWLDGWRGRARSGEVDGPAPPGGGAGPRSDGSS